MNGQMTRFEEDQAAVDRYVEAVGLYAEKEPLRFNIRAYDRYMLMNDLVNPDDIPAEVMETFWIDKAQETA